MKNKTHSSNSRYLLYGAQSGWSNQVVCLEHAIWLAKALNRTLILPPVLPHHGKGSVDHSTFVKNTVVEIYRSQDIYVELSKVLETSLLNVSVIDFRAIDAQLNELTEKEVDQYTHRNTQWIYNARELEGVSQYIREKEYGEWKRYAQVYRDVVTELKAFDSYNIITFPQVYRSLFYHESIQMDSFNIVYAETIRARAHRIKASMGHYLSIHIRGGDGIFKKKLGSQKVIETIFERALNLLQQYSHQQPNIRSYSLHIATDIPDIESELVFQQALVGLREVISNPISIVTSTKYADEAKALSDELNMNGMLFLDQQIAACAPIGFTGTSNISGLMDSTFTSMIENLRKNHACY